MRRRQEVRGIAEGFLINVNQYLFSSIEMRAGIVLFITLGWALCVRGSEALVEEDFSDGLDKEWSWIREHPETWRLKDGVLEVQVEPGNMWGPANNARNVLLRPVPSGTEGEIEVTASVENRPTAQYEQVDLVWFGDEGHMVKLGQELVNGQLSIVMGREEADKTVTIAIIPIDLFAVQLRLRVNGRRIQGQFAALGSDCWRTAGECQSPVEGVPKISLQFYQGPQDDQHWAKIRSFSMRRPAPRLVEKRATGKVTGVVQYQKDARRPWKLGRYYLRTGCLAEAVLVLSDSRLPGLAPLASPKTVVMDQKDYQFVPENLAIRVGDSVRFTNSDAALHNVLNPTGRNPFNINVVQGGEYLHTFNASESIDRPAQIGCVYHGAMRAWIFVLDHPWYAMTGQDGRFLLDNVPVGDHSLHLIHPAGKLRWRGQVRVQPGQHVEMTITLSPDDLRSSP